MESEEEALSATIESIRQNLENGELESCNLLKLVEISDELRFLIRSDSFVKTLEWLQNNETTKDLNVRV